MSLYAKNVAQTMRNLFHYRKLNFRIVLIVNLKMLHERCRLREVLEIKAVHHVADRVLPEHPERGRSALKP